MHEVEYSTTLKKMLYRRGFECACKPNYHGDGNECVGKYNYNTVSTITTCENVWHKCNFPTIIYNIINIYSIIYYVFDILVHK